MDRSALRPGAACALASAWLLAGAVCALAQTPAAAATPAAADEPLKVHVFTFEHQSADDALGEIRSLFSDRGSVELKQSGSTVVLRDREDELEKILRTLRDFDHPRRALRLQFQLLRAHRVPFSPQQVSQGVSPALVARLKQVLRYDTYESLAETSFVSGEGEEVAYDFGDDLGMDFRVGTVLQSSRIGLKDFRILRKGPFGIAASGGVTVLHANLVLRLGQTMAMVLTRDEASDNALVVAITCNPADGEPGSR
jgi:hypothetical protein